AGDGGVTLFLQQLLGSFEGWWGQLATWQRLEPEQQRALTQSIERAYKSNIEQLREARDRRLGAILRVLEQARTASRLCDTPLCYVVISLFLFGSHHQ